jgi:uncharacterized protein (DUF1800 family)
MKDLHISRRDVLRAGSLATAWTALASCSPPAALLNWALDVERDIAQDEPTAEPTATTAATPASPLNDDALLLHTLRRMSFGTTQATLDRARAIGLEAYVEEQLNPGALDDHLVEDRVRRLDTMKRTLGELLTEEQRGRIVAEFLLATLIRQAWSPKQFYEMLVDFWTNHFNIFIGKNMVRVLKIFDDQEAIRPNALASFSKLLHASARSPAMLVYLDQALSSKEAPNENYARELLELHTLGVDGGYTQQDVYETARTLTGWSVVGPRGRRQAGGEPGSFVFRPRRHDDGEKQVMDLTIPAGSGQAGGEMLLDYLADHPSTARFVSHRLAVRFVADAAPPPLVDRLADSFQRSGGDVQELLRTLIFSSEFAASAGQKVKRPLEFFVSLIRATDLQITGRPRPLFEALRLLGQMPYGWPSPDGYPDYADWWLTTSGLLNRWNLAMRVATGALPGVRVPYRRLLADAQSPVDVVDLLCTRFLGEPLPSDARDLLVSFASDGNLRDNVPAVAGLILGSPHFQMR